MTYPGQRVQVDVKVVPRKCIADPELRLFQYTAIDEFTRLRFLAAYPEQSTYSSADFLRKLRARSSAATARIRNASTLAARSIPWMTLQSSLPSTTVVPTTYP